MDRILSDYQYYFIFLSYGVFFTFFSAIFLYYTIQYRHYTQKISILNLKNRETHTDDKQ
jgi:hypothetical protein